MLLAGFLLFLPSFLIAQDPGQSNPGPIDIVYPEIGKLNLQKLDDYIRECMPEWRVPGMAIAIVKDDSVVFASGYGVKELGKPGKVDEYTLFSIASLTKGFTSTALAMLDDDGLLDWDDPVRKYLPDFSLYDDYVSEEIRIRDLLSHRSGLETFSGDLLWLGTDYSRAEIIRRARYLEPSHGFRYKFGYSNLMFLTAGEIIPVASEMTWESYLEQKILQPLGMEYTSLSLEGMMGGMMGGENVASPHFVDLLGDSVQVLPYRKLNNIAPAVGMNSNVMDLTRWIRFHLNMGEWEGVQLLSPENLWETRKLHTEQSPELYQKRFWPSMHFQGYGLGWDLYDYHGWKLIAHEGGIDGMIARLVMVPDENFGFVMLTNSINGFTTGLEYYILDQYYQGKSYDWSNIFLESITSYLGDIEKEWMDYLDNSDRSLKPTMKLKSYTGTYGGELYGNVEVRKEKEGLVLDFLPSNLLIGDLEEFSRDTFLITLRDMPNLPRGTVKFYLDNSGDVEEIKIDIPNPDFDFTELELKLIED